MAGNYTLTAFVTIALTEYGSASTDALAAASAYLVDNLSTVQDDAYALAVAALAFAKVGNSTAADSAIDRLLEIAITDGEGIHWEPHPIETTEAAGQRRNQVACPSAEQPRRIRLHSGYGDGPKGPDDGGAGPITGR